MKLLILWVLPLLWALLFLNLAFGRFEYAWSAEGSIFNMGQKLEALLAGIGAITMGLAPIYFAYRLHRFHKSRESHRLKKQRSRLDKKIDKLERNKEAPSSTAAAVEPELDILPDS